MRRLIATTMISLDGVLQAPGGPDEDPSGGFALGGWSFSYWGGAGDLPMKGLDGKDRELVLGRRTYEIFEAYWPFQPAEDPIAQALNSARKHVATRTRRTLDWANSTPLQGDVAAAVAALKAQPGLDLQVIGSGHLLQTLHAAGLVDEYNLLTFPIVLGRGKRLFESGARPGALRLVATQAAPNGVVLSTFEPAGEVASGSFAQAAPSAREIKRRAKLAREDR